MKAPYSPVPRRAHLGRILLPAALALLAPWAVAQKTQVLVATGDELPGLGPVQAVYEVAIDEAGSWAATVATAGMAPGEVAILRDGAVFLRPGDPLDAPTFGGPLPTDTFRHARKLHLTADGSLTWEFHPPLASAAVQSPARGVFRDTVALAVQGQAVATSGVNPAGTFQGFYAHAPTPTGGALIYAAIDAPSGVWVLVRFEPDGSGGFAKSLLNLEFTQFPGDRVVAANAAGQALWATNDSLRLDGTPLAQSGQNSVLFGAKWGSFHDAVVALNARGDHAYFARAGQKFVLVWNGVKVVAQGETLPAIAPYTLSGTAHTALLATLKLAADGRILWYGEWDEPDTSRNAGLFIDHDLVLQKGEGGIFGFDFEDFRATGGAPSRPSFDLSPAGTFLGLRARLSDGRTALVRVRTADSAIKIPGCAANPLTLSNSLGGTGFTAPLVSTIYANGVEPGGAYGLLYLAFAPLFPCGLELAGIGEVLLDPAAVFAVLPSFAVLPGFAVFAPILPPASIQTAGLEFTLQAAVLPLPGQPGAIQLSDAATFSYGL